MRKYIWHSVAIAGILLASPIFVRGGAGQRALKPEFHTSDRCVACHNGMKTKSGEDISIGFDWRASRSVLAGKCAARVPRSSGIEACN